MALKYCVVVVNKTFQVKALTGQCSRGRTQCARLGLELHNHHPGRRRSPSRCEGRVIALSFYRAMAFRYLVPGAICGMPLCRPQPVLSTRQHNAQGPSSKPNDKGLPAVYQHFDNRRQTAGALAPSPPASLSSVFIYFSLVGCVLLWPRRGHTSVGVSFGVTRRGYKTGYMAHQEISRIHLRLLTSF